MKSTHPAPIAIVGIGCRFPGGIRDPGSFWDALARGVDAVGPVPQNRFGAERLYDPRPGTPGRIIQREGGYLDDIENFDAAYFGITPREARLIDPQQRLLLEISAEALADAGLPAARYRGAAAGVYVGIWTSDYEARVQRALDDYDLYSTTGTGRYSAAGRIAFALDLRGPSLAVDTACSSSLVGVHLACQALGNGECDFALAGGVNLILDPAIHIGYSRSRMLSPTGRCRFGDHDAAGYVRSEGAGLLVLKPLERARADGDRIYALIQGGAVNNDGRASGFLVQPAREGQRAMLEAAYRNAAIDPRDVAYVECHGTGTRAGDPVEIDALSAVLCARERPEANESETNSVEKNEDATDEDATKRTEPLLLGSVKTNLGHTEAASGVAGLIKAALVLEHERIPASLHFDRPNPAIPFAERNVLINTELREWPAGRPMIAGVNSFGITGTNAHIILSADQDGPRAPATHDAQDKDARDVRGGAPHLLVLSAADKQALRARAEQIRTTLLELARDEQFDLYDFCYSAAARSTHFAFRLSVTGDTTADLIARLDAFLSGQSEPAFHANAEGLDAKLLDPATAAHATPGVAFVVSGQGPKFWPLVTADLDEVFRARLREYDGVLAELGDWSLLAELNDPDSKRLASTRYTQPALTAIQIALAESWRARGLLPAAVVGHSMGEVPAACIAGALTPEQALRVADARGRWIETVSGQGAMAFVELSFAESQRFLEDHGLNTEVVRAAANSPRNTVLSGAPAPLDKALAILKEGGVFARRLASVEFASHSPYMDPILEPFRQDLQNIEPSPTTAPFYSTVTTEIQSGDACNADYWARNLRRPVLFADTIARMTGDGHRLFLEIGPHPALSSSVRASAPDGCSIVPSLHREELAETTLRRAIGALYCDGAIVDPAGLYPNGRFVRLPAYPWNRQRYWIEEGPSLDKNGANDAKENAGGEFADLSGSIVTQSVADERETDAGQRFALRLDDENAPARASHQVRGVRLLPAAYSLEILRALARLPASDRASDSGDMASPKTTSALREIVFAEAIPVATGPIDLQLERDVRENGRVEIFFGDRTGQAHAFIEGAPGTTRDEADRRDRQDRAEPAIDSGGIARELERAGIVNAADLSGLLEIERSHSGLRATFACAPRLVASESRVRLLDACIQAALLSGKIDHECFLAESIARADCADLEDFEGHARIETRLHERNDDEFTVSAIARDRNGAQLARLESIRLRRINRNLDRLFYNIAWAKAELPEPSPAAPFFEDGVAIIAPVHDRTAQELERKLRDNGNRVIRLDPGEVPPDTENLIYFADRTTGDPRESALMLGFLLGCYHKRAMRSGSNMFLITIGARVVSNEQPDPDQAMIWAALQSALLERPAALKLIDLDPRQDENEAARRLFETLSRQDIPARSAIREESLYAPRLRRILPPAMARFSADPNGAYLITGGTGSLGRTMAAWLGERGARTIVITGRTDPDRGPTDPGHERLREQKEPGKRSDLHFVPVDLNETGDLIHLLARFGDDLPPLKGVIHAAGLTADHPLEDVTAADFEKVLSPKLNGARVLHEHAPRAALDFVLLIGSSQGVLGGARAAPYAAANAYLHAFAHAHYAEDFPVSCLAFGPWRDQGLGDETVRATMERAGLGTLRIGEALGGLEDLLAGGRSAPRNLLMARIDWDRYGIIHDDRIGDDFLLQLRTTSRGYAKNPEAAAVATTSSSAEADQDAGELVRSAVRGVLGGDVGARDGFFERGMDSLMAVELARRLGAAFGTTLPTTTIFDYPNLEALSGEMNKRFGITADAKSTQNDSTNVSIDAGAADANAVAIIGMGCRFPGGVATPADFWQLLDNGVDATETIPPSRFDIDRWYDPDPGKPGKMFTRRGGFLKDIDRFDAGFFQIAPREAIHLDPQQRIMLEVAWEALEHAGVHPDTLRESRTGVYTGMTLTDYYDIQKKQNDPAAFDMYSGTGGSLYGAAGRLSYFMGTQGPSMTIDAACASSLVSVQLAMQALRSGECELALAGGVNVILLPDSFLFLSRTGGLAPDGRCKAFSDEADGFGRAEGCGIVVLKPLARARRDGDRVLAVLRGGAVAQDGASGGLTVPNGRAQQKLIRRALADAGLEPGDLDYIETHGTGTPLGDPIEFSALQEVFGPERETNRPLTIGSVKTNIGHTEAAAGVAGLIKTVLAMRAGSFPPHLHLNKINPAIDLDTLPARIPKNRIDWRARPGRPRRAGVSSFGISGTLAHIVLEEAPDSAPERIARVKDEAALRRTRLFVVTARDPAALRETARHWIGGLADPGLDLDALCDTAARRRRHFDERAAIAFDDREELIDAMGALARDEGHARLTRGRAVENPGPLVFVCSGNGSHWPAMQSALENFPAARDELDRLREALRRSGTAEDRDIFARLSTEGADSDFDEPAVLQPAVWAMQTALAKLLEEYGFRPELILGHSMGEVAAAAIAGILSTDDAARVITARGQLIGRLRGGRTAVAGLDASRLQIYLNEHNDRSHDDMRLDIAGWNGPETTIFSGDARATGEMVARLEDDDIFAREVRMPFASHGPRMDSILDDLRARLTEIKPRAGTTSFISTVTGRPFSGAELDAAYWTRNVREPVRFYQSLGEIPEGATFIELAPHPVLQNAIIESRPDDPVLAALRRDEAWRPVLTVGELFTRGYRPDFARFIPTRPPVDLPTYRFQRESYWIETHSAETRAAPATPPADDHPLLGRREGTRSRPVFRSRPALDRLAFVRDHVIQDQLLLPGTGFVSMALDALARTDRTGDTAPWLRKVEFKRPLFLDENAADAPELITYIEENRFRIECETTGGEAELLCSGEFAAESAESAESVPDDRLDLAFLRLEMERTCPAEDFDRALREAGLAYGPAFRDDSPTLRATGQALRRITRPASLKNETEYGVHPALLDLCFQTLHLACNPHDPPNLPGPLVFESIGRLRLIEKLPDLLWCYARARAESTPTRPVADVWLTGADGRILLAGESLRIRYLDPTAEGRFWREEPRKRSDPSANTTPSATSAPVSSRRAILVLSKDVDFNAALERRARTAGLNIDFADTFAATDFTRPDQDILYYAPSAGASALESDTPAIDVRDGLVEHCRRLLAIYRARAPGSKLFIVTRGGRGATAGNDPVAWGLWGFARGLAGEAPDFIGGLIDLDPKVSPVENTGLLLEELLRYPSVPHENRIVIRDGNAYGLRLVDAAPDVAGLDADAQVEIDPSAVYLISGGTGALGLMCAAWLGMQGAREIVLVSRTGRPDLNAADEFTRKQIEELKSKGLRLNPVAADVADEEAMSALFQNLTRPLKGVIHAAGVQHPEALEELNTAGLTRELDAKVTGGLLLDRLTADLRLDFFVCFSSAAALLDSPLLAGYATANAFLDGLVARRRERGLPGLAINWGFFAEVGMAARGGYRFERSTHGLGALTSGAGMNAMARGLAAGTERIAVLEVDWRRYAELHPHLRSSAYLSECPGIGQNAPATGVPSPASADPREALRGLVSAVLRMPPEKVETEAPLTRLGLDSMLAVELKRKMRSDLHVEIPVVMLLRNISINQLADRIRPAPDSTGSDSHDLQDFARRRRELNRPRELLERLEHLPDEEVAAYLRELSEQKA